MRRRKVLASVPSIAAAGQFTVQSVDANKKSKRIVTGINRVGFSSDSVDASVHLVQEEMDRNQTVIIDYELEITNDGGTTLGWTAPNGVNAVFGERNKGNKQAIFIGIMNTWQKSSDEVWKADKNMLKNGGAEDIHMSEELLKDQTFNNRLQLWTGPGNGNNNLPPGTYEFSRNYTVESDSEPSDATFSFEIKIDN